MRPSLGDTPARVLAIGIRQLSPREATGLSSMMGMTSTQPMPVTDVPVFTGTTGSNIMKTMLPYLKQKLGPNGPGGVTSRRAKFTAVSSRAV